MASLREGLGMSGKVLGSVLAIALLVLLVWMASFAIDYAAVSNHKFFKIGETATQTPLNVPFLEEASRIGLGTTSPLTVEKLILHLAIFFILLFAFGEIMSLFSVFSDTTSWVIAFGLTIVAGVTRVIAQVSILMAGTAGLGAFGVMIIILTSILSAVLLHMGLGYWFKKWRLLRQDEITEFKTSKGIIKLKSGISTLKGAGEANTEDE